LALLHKRQQRHAPPNQTAGHGSNRKVEQFGRFAIAEAFDEDERDDFALLVRQTAHGSHQPLEVELGVHLRRRIVPDVLPRLFACQHLAGPNSRADSVDPAIAHYAVKPRVESGTFLPLHSGAERALDCDLGQIVGIGAIGREAMREPPQPRQQSLQSFLELAQVVFPCSCGLNDIARTFNPAKHKQEGNAVIRPSLRSIMICGAAIFVAGSAEAQLLPSLGGVLPGQSIGGVLGTGGAAPVVAPVIDRLNDVAGTVTGDTTSLLDLRRARLRGLVRDHHRVLDADREGNPIRRGEIVAIDPLPATIAQARSTGFRIVRDEQIEGLELHVVTFAPPAGDDTREGLARLRQIAPQAEFDYDHIFEPAGMGLLALGGSAAAAAGSRGVATVGMIDGGVSAHPALRHATIEQRGFAAPGPRPSGHGTAVASLIVGSDGRFQGAARDASLLVADVYGGDPTEGSALTIARALGWLTARGVRVINISLVGPPNPLLARAVATARARGILIVAAVGNDGPAAPPSYPASYPGVVAVTGVDAHDRALREAGRALHLDFAAPGADMAAALPRSGYAAVRGTSFAAPLVTARLVLAGGGDPAIEAVSREAVSGRGKVGKGVVCGACRIGLRDVGAKR